MRPRYLIISADDFGYSESTNAAVLELFRAERISAAGILSVGPCAEEACEAAKQERLPVGVHWTLHSDWDGEMGWKPCAEADRIGSLLKGDRLTPDTAQVARAKSAHVTAELEAQYQYLVSRDCLVDHADSHGGTLYGTNGRLFFLNAFRLCRKHGLPFRFAKEESFLARLSGKEPSPLLKIAQKAIVGAARVHRVALLGDFCSEPHRVKDIQEYDGLKAYYEQALGTLSGDIAEIFLHPSQPDDDLLEKTPEWQKRVWEYEYLKSGDLLTAAKNAGFTVVSWGEAFGRVQDGTTHHQA